MYFVGVPQLKTGPRRYEDVLISVSIHASPQCSRVFVGIKGTRVMVMVVWLSAKREMLEGFKKLRGRGSVLCYDGSEPPPLFPRASFRCISYSIRNQRDLITGQADAVRDRP